MRKIKYRAGLIEINWGGSLFGGDVFYSSMYKTGGGGQKKRLIREYPKKSILSEGVLASNVPTLTLTILNGIALITIENISCMDP